MFNRLHIEKLERELEQTKRDALPQIVETVKDTKDEKVQVNQTSGTVRRDILDGEETQRPMEAPKEKYEDRTVYFPETVAPEVGKVIKETAEAREIELKHSGTSDVGTTVRTDYR